MGHYLFHGSYTQSGIQGVLKEGGSGRMKAIEALAASSGGRVESAYWAFGTDDFFITAELPDNAAAASLAATVAAAGSVRITTTVLLTAAEVDDAASRHPSYRPPGA